MYPRKELCVREKLDLVEFSKSTKWGVRKVAEHFKISKSAVAQIIRNEELLRRLWLESGNDKAIRISSGTNGAHIDKMVFEWFCQIRANKRPVSGPILQRKAKEVAEGLGLLNFKASNGWLQKFRVRHAISSFKSLFGESAGDNVKNVSLLTKCT